MRIYRMLLAIAALLLLASTPHAISASIKNGHISILPIDAAPPAPVNLQINWLTDPVGIDIALPRFTWQHTHADRAQQQTAFILQVATDEAFSPSSIVWSISTKTSDPFVKYAGNALVSDTSYVWRVMWVDAAGATSAWSEVARFDTGLMRAGDWTAKWISGTGNLYRKVFQVQGKSTRARLFVSGIGYNEVYINGQRVGNSLLDPGWTTYQKRVLYSTYDITSLLQSGDNVVGVMLGHGWYGTTEAREPNGPRSLLLQMNIYSAPGAAPQVVATDTTWAVAQGPITYDHIYNGETYDARLEIPGWDTPTYKQSANWTAATSVAGPGGIVVAQNIRPIRATQVMNPIAITNPQSNVYVFDFGQNFAGFCLLNITGPAGASVTLKHAEVLQHSGNGMIYTDNLRSAKATDVYTLKGDANGELWHPRFTYHGFRYVEFTASWTFTPTLRSLSAWHIHSDVFKSGDISFESSSPILNQIQHNVVWGQRSNLMSVPTDCDQRDERKGWMGDAFLTTEEALHNFDLPSFYAHWLHVIEDEQLGGGVPDTAPWTFGTDPGDPAWGAAYPGILYWVYKYRGDADLLHEHYGGVRAYIEFLASKAKQSGLRDMYFNYGDWVPPPPVPMCNSHMTASFAFLASLQQFIEIARVVGNTTDVALYTNLSNALAYEFNEAFYDGPSAWYDTGLQTAQAMPLALGIVPSDQRDVVINGLLNDIGKRGHLSTGITGTKYLFIVLDMIGRLDVALQLAENVDYPSFGYMIVNPIEPATTFWELWNTPTEGPGMNSRNHIMFGSVGDWFYKSLAGIKSADDDQTGGFKTVSIAPPNVVSGLLGVNASFETGYGQVSSSWKRSGGSVICGQGAENHVVELDCARIGSGGVITDIVFASWGTPLGHCTRYAPDLTCNLNITAQAAQWCVGKSSCSFNASTTTFTDDPCFGNFKRAYVQAVCSEPAAPKIALDVAVPVGATAYVSIPRLDISNMTVTESGNVIWQNGKFAQNAASGVTAGTLSSQAVTFNTGSGTYMFSAQGSPAASSCAVVNETVTAQLKCPDPAQTITYVSFASWGTPQGTCGNFYSYNCHAGSSVAVVERACLGKSSCSVTANNDAFGEPCEGVKKSLSIQVVCAF